ncbi:MAG: NrfD/PsrC family molybdoenzyme membrane anchor subunit [Acidimicrobiales bacterium]
MNETEVTTEGLKNVRPGRDALTGVNTGTGPQGQPPTARKERRRGGEQAMVPEAEFGSYYGKPILNSPVWESPDIPGYLFLGGLGGAGSVIAAGAQATGRPRLARVLKVGAMAAGGLSTVALVHDLGRPGRFLNMLRTFKPTSPMSIGSWLLATYGPAATVAAASDVSGIAPWLGNIATVTAAAVGPGLATYTAALVTNTAVPAWHDGFRDMPFVFAASAIASAAGLGLVGAPVSETGPVRALAVVAGAAELATEKVMEQRMGIAAEAYHKGKAARYRKAAQGLLGAGVAGALVGGRRRALSALSGACLLAGSACTRFAVFEAGLTSAEDPKYTVVPQRQRLDRRDGIPTDGRPDDPPVDVAGNGNAVAGRGSRG